MDVLSVQISNGVDVLEVFQGDVQLADLSNLKYNAKMSILSSSNSLTVRFEAGDGGMFQFNQGFEIRWTCVQTGSTGYSGCDKGTYAAQGSMFCSPCPQDFYCLDPAQAPVACPSNTTSLEGQSICSCKYGYVSKDGFAPCSKCPAGNKYETTFDPLTFKMTGE